MLEIPITPEDFRVLGARFVTEEILPAMDRLAPLALRDAVGLATQEYEESDREELLAYRAQLTGESAERRAARGTKKGARRNESAAITTGKRELRGGIDVVMRAIANRNPEPDEAPEQTMDIARSYLSRLDALSGRIGLDSAKLRTRLSGLLTLLREPGLAPRPAAVAARAERIAKVEKALTSLPALAETKKGLQAGAVRDTSDLDEVEGRAYFNLKQLCSAGRAYHQAAGDVERAAQYQLNELKETPKRKAAGDPKAAGPQAG